MLILTRTIGKAFLIGDNVRVSIQGVNRGKVMLGIEAPEDVIVLREELVGREREEASDDD